MIIRNHWKVQLNRQDDFPWRLAERSVWVALKKKTKKRLWIALIIIVVIIAGVLIAGYVAVNTMFSVFTDSLSHSSISLTLPDDSAGGGKSGDNNVSPDSGSPAEQAGNAGETASPGEEGGDKPSDNSSGKASSKLEVSGEKLKELEKKVSFSDKISVMAILSRNLSASDYTELVQMANGGVTQGEIERAKDILREKLNVDAKVEILNYYNKYVHLLN